MCIRDRHYAEFSVSKTPELIIANLLHCSNLSAAAVQTLVAAVNLIGPTLDVYIFCVKKQWIEIISFR